jgi:aminopeptidase 2
MGRQVLPKTVKPTHYKVTLVPNLESFIFTGQVSISLQVKEATKLIQFNSKRNQ